MPLVVVMPLIDVMPLVFMFLPLPPVAVEIGAQRLRNNCRKRLFGLDGVMLNLANQFARQIYVELFHVFRHLLVC